MSSCICIALFDNILSITIAFLMPVFFTNTYCSCPISGLIHQDTNDKFCYLAQSADRPLEFTFIYVLFLCHCYENISVSVLLYVTCCLYNLPSTHSTSVINISGLSVFISIVGCSLSSWNSSPAY